MPTKRDPISEILEEAKQEAEHLTKHRSIRGSRIRITVLCALLSNIKIPAERKKEVVEAIGEMTTAASGIIDRKFFEMVIKKIRS